MRFRVKKGFVYLEKNWQMNYNWEMNRIGRPRETVGSVTSVCLRVF